MESNELARLLMQGAVDHNSNFAVLREDSASSGIIINELNKLIPDPLTIYQLENGVLFELNPLKVADFFPEYTSFTADRDTDLEFNKFLYRMDTTILDMLCGMLANNGLNSLIPYLKDTEEPTDMHDMTALLMTLILNYDFCHYPVDVKTKLQAMLDKGNNVRYWVSTLNDDFTANSYSSEVLKRIAYDMFCYDLFTETEAELVKYSKYLNNLGMCISNSNFASDDSKYEFIAKYIISMVNRGVFSSVYAKKNTFGYLIGCSLNNNNYTCDYKCVQCSAYKLSLADMSNALIHATVDSKLYMRGLLDKEIAVDLKEITSFTAKELLKEGMASDGADSVVFQQILQY